MKNYPISDFIDDLKKEKASFLMELLLYLQTEYVPTLEKLLESLSDNDNYELQISIFKYFTLHNKYKTLLPSYCQVNFKEAKNFHFLEEQIESNSLPLAQRNTLYWTAFILTTQTEDINFTDQKKSYMSLLESAKKTLDLSLLNELDIKVDEKRVFLYTNQFFYEEHAPTKTTNVWADTFKELGYKVIIVSSTSSKFMYPTSLSYKYGKLLNVGESKELREGIFLIEVGGNFMHQDIYAKLIEAVHMNKNDKFLLIGDSCLVFDILPFKHKYLIPSVTPKETILTTAQNYIYNQDKNITNIFSEKMRFIHGPDDYSSSKDLLFKPPRLEKGSTINIALIGNRLQSDLTDSFWSDMDILINNNKNILLHLIGDIEIHDIPNKYLKYIVLAGFQKDLFSYLKKIDFYLNPPREGGGHSAAMAIKLGIPVITLAKGDVYGIILHKYCIKDMSEVYDFIYKYINDSTFKKSIDSHNEELVKLFAKSKETLKEIAIKIMED